jgi:hypothetical protein
VQSVGAVGTFVPLFARSGMTPKANTTTWVTAWKATKEEQQTYAENI